MVGDILQPTHLLFILVVALLVLGPKRLPEVGRTLGSGLRDFRQAINGETHDDRPPHADVETQPEPEPDPVPARELDAPQTGLAGVAVATENLVEPTAAENEPAAPTTLHELPLDPQAPGDDLDAPAPTEDLHPPAATDEHATVDLHPPAAADDLPEPVPAAEPDVAPAPVAVASGSGFASALASSRQRSADGGEPAADDE